MNKIILIGDREKQVEKIISKYLENFLVIDDNSVSKHGNTTDIIIIHSNNLNTIDSEDCIIVFCNGTNNLYKIKPNNIAIIQSTYNETINFLIKNNIPIIKVGMQNNDTITYSSKTMNKMIISIQRDILNYKGNIVEPEEISVITKNSYYDDNNILLSIAVLVFINKLPDHITI